MSGSHTDLDQFAQELAEVLEQERDRPYAVEVVNGAEFDRRKDDEKNKERVFVIKGSGADRHFYFTMGKQKQFLTEKEKEKVKNRFGDEDIVDKNHNSLLFSWNGGDGWYLVTSTNI